MDTRIAAVLQDAYGPELPDDHEGRGSDPPSSDGDIVTLQVRTQHAVLQVPARLSSLRCRLPPAVGRAVDRAVDARPAGPILRTSRGTRMDRHCATRRLHHLAAIGGVRAARMHPHMLRHTIVTTMLDAGVDLRDVQIAARHADRARPCATTAPGRTSTDTNYIVAAYLASGT